ncbi:vav isoform 1, partial [Danaus plexippus plexippus]
DTLEVFFQELHDIHNGLLRQLRLATDNCVPGSGAPRLADVFLAWRERLLLYGDYCSNLTNAQDTLKALDARDSTFSKQLLKCQKEHSDGRIQLRDILSVPMQRVLKYHLLLDKLVHETQPNHEEFRGLERAKEAMVDVAQYINEVKRDSEVLVLLAKLQESIVDWDRSGAEGGSLAAYGRLLLDGELKVKAHEDQKMRMRYVFVFDKYMLLCKPVKVIYTTENQYSYRKGIKLAEYRVEEGGPRRSLRADARWTAHFFLVRRTKDATYTLYAKTEDCRRKWLKAINDAMLVTEHSDTFDCVIRIVVVRSYLRCVHRENLEPPGCRRTNHKFVLHTFEKPATCHHCSKFLKGRIFQVGYVGEMSRETATSRLERRVDGTFLLRVRPRAALHDTQYALSLKTDNTVKHMRVCLKPIDSVPHYYLSESRFFRSVVELISYYEKTSLSENFVGYVGEMSRETATSRLERRVDGTFLLRVRPRAALHDTQYALSLKTDNTVKHMRVCLKPIDSVPHYYLSESRFFRSVVELISYYEKTSLSENFVGLNSNLRWPFRRVVATVIHDFRPLEASQLALRPGAKVLVLSKEGDGRGWWKGRTLDKGDHRSGYFPKECVREEPECIGALD